MLRLLLAGVEPARIVALTFTRKAAGEFLENLLLMLAEGAQDPERAAELAKQSRAIEDGHGRLGCEAFSGSLRRVVADLGRLQLGTLDSFFSRILRAYSLEFGLPGDFELMVGEEMERERDKALRKVFALEGEKRNYLICSFAETLHGGMAKEAAEEIARFIEVHHAEYLRVPDANKWGNERAIWGVRGCPWPTGVNVAQQLMRIKAGLDEICFHSPKARERLVAMLDGLSEWTLGADIPKEVAYVFERALRSLPQLLQGSGDVMLERKLVTLTGEVAMGLGALVEGWIGWEIHGRLRATKGICGVLALFEEVYQKTARERGKLVFSDLPFLLVAGSGGNGLEQLDIEYRLDASFDHWLLDEFQDTSRLQWQVIANLIDEVVQDAEKKRSFFYVGDVKQSIYSWRGGDPKLFEDVYRRYAGGGSDGIVERSLNESWRSCPQVLEMVNRVFNPDGVMAEVFPYAAERWRGVWGKHTPAPPLDAEAGFAVLVNPVAGDNLDEEDDAGEDVAIQAMVRIISKVEPLRRGLTCAVIVSKNSYAEKCVHALRRHGIPALRDGEVAIGDDNPLARALLRLLDLAVHPGDSFARNFLAWGPLGEAVRTGQLGDIDSWEKVAEAVRRSVESHGFRVTIEEWISQFRPLEECDDFTLQRANAILQLAGKVDRDGERDITVFRRILADAVLVESGGDYAIQVMTVHKSKGLGFDMVVLPELDSRGGVAMAREGLWIKPGKDNEVRWVLDPPRKLIAEADTVLAGVLAEVQEEACFEAFCRLYVALTRAKRAVYAIACKPAMSSKSKSYATWLYGELGSEDEDLSKTGDWAGDEVVWYSGRDDWFQAMPIIEGKQSSEEQARLPELVISARDHQDTSGRQAEQLEVAPPPSMHAGGGDGIDVMLGVENHRAMQLGTRVHACLATVLWPGEAPPAACTSPAAKNDPAVRLIVRALENQTIRKALSRPSQEASVLLEQPFEVCLNGRRLSGIIDRLVIQRENGQVVRAIVQDFKTDVREASAEKYRSQLLAYRAAASALLGLPEDRIDCQVLFLSPANLSVCSI